MALPDSGWTTGSTYKIAVAGKIDGKRKNDASQTRTVKLTYKKLKGSTVVCERELASVQVGYFENLIHV